MKAVTVFQTLENRNNPDEIERSGPFLCERTDAWLGKGYYFWESYIANAHWWGSHCYKSEGYIICKATYVANDQKCLDLTGNNPEHLELINGAISYMRNEGLYSQKTTAARIIKFIQTNITDVEIAAVKANIIGSRTINNQHNSRITVKHNSTAYIDLCPQIQICFFSKKSLQLSDYKIVYPEEYIEGYAV